MLTLGPIKVLIVYILIRENSASLDCVPGWKGIIHIIYNFTYYIYIYIHICVYFNRFLIELRHVMFSRSDDWQKDLKSEEPILNIISKIHLGSVTV